jgi:protein involved in temperature-dependent protein secretion
MNDAKLQLDAGNLTGAVEAALKLVKTNPTNEAARTFLFELSCFSGEWERAEKQLEVIGHQDAKAMIGRDGIGCEPASATTVAGIRKLVLDGAIGRHETVVAVLTGHVLKDTDYVMKYHKGSLIAPDGTPIEGTFANTAMRVKSVDEICEVLNVE